MCSDLFFTLKSDEMMIVIGSACWFEFLLLLCWQSAAKTTTAWWQQHRFVTENRPVKDWASSNQPQGRISYCSILIHVHINNCRWHC